MAALLKDISQPQHKKTDSDKTLGVFEDTPLSLSLFILLLSEMFFFGSG